EGPSRGGKIESENRDLRDEGARHGIHSANGVAALRRARALSLAREDAEQGDAEVEGEIYLPVLVRLVAAVGCDGGRQQGRHVGGGGGPAGVDRHLVLVG